MHRIPGGAKEVQLGVGIQTKLAQPRAQLQNKSLVLLVGIPVIGGQLEELPLLVDLLDLAIYILLDLLCLLVKLDELAVPNGLVVGVDAGTTADDVEDGSDILRGAVAQSVLCLGMTTRDRLSSDLLDARRFDCERWLVHLVQGHDARLVVSHGGVRNRGRIGDS